MKLVFLRARKLEVSTCVGDFFLQDGCFHFPQGRSRHGGFQLAGFFYFLVINDVKRQGEINESITRMIDINSVFVLTRKRRFFAYYITHQKSEINPSGVFVEFSNPILCSLQ